MWNIVNLEITIGKLEEELRLINKQKEDFKKGGIYWREVNRKVYDKLTRRYVKTRKRLRLAKKIYKVIRKLYC